VKDDRLYLGHLLEAIERILLYVQDGEERFRTDVRTQDVHHPEPAGPGGSGERRRDAVGRGTRLGRYEVTELLGAGGMGEVYRARDTRLGRDVAVKVLPEHVAHDADALARFGREARAVAALSHPTSPRSSTPGRRTARTIGHLLLGLGGHPKPRSASSNSPRVG